MVSDPKWQNGTFLRSAIMDKYQMDSAFNIVAKDKILGKLADHHRLMSVLKTASQTLLGQLHRHIEIVDVRDHVLILETANPIWVSEIRRYEKMILSRLIVILEQTFGKEHPKILSIKVIILSKRSQSKGLVKNEAYTQDKGVSLEEMVMRENKIKLEKGYVWCGSCGDILTDQKLCAFCRSSGY